MSLPYFFGIRHLSPAAAFHVRTLLDKLKPKLILIEGPSDLNKQMEWLCHPEAIYPIAILAYTKSTPIRSILYPLAIYSPEVQAILWAHEHNVKCRFMDLPSAVFLALGEDNEKQFENKDSIGEESGNLTTEQAYSRLELLSGEDHDSFWERNFEHIENAELYAQASATFSLELRNSVDDSLDRQAENIVREAYMKRVIVDSLAQGYKAEQIFCVCGSFHVEGLMHNEPLTDAELAALPKVESDATLMPYSYYRLSDRSGYGAGNKAPQYFHLLWEALNSGGLHHLPYLYLASLAASQRKFGNLVSSAEIIEAVRLAQTLATMRNSRYPSWPDLHDAAITTIGHGCFSELALAFADTDIGTTIGFLPEGISRTSLQEDFYRQLKGLHLERFRTAVSQPLDLDLRENLRVKSKEAAFLDLRRSFFLHRLRILGISFANLSTKKQMQANWGEYWFLRWTPEAEIELAESSLLGDTIEEAAITSLKERCQKSDSIATTASLLKDAFLGGLSVAFQYVLSALQKLSTEAASLEDIAQTADESSLIIRCENLRQLDCASLWPLIEQLYLRACLIMEESCYTNEFKPIRQAMEQINKLQLNHSNLDVSLWTSLLKRLSVNDKLNACLSGFAMALLLERGITNEEELNCEIGRRLSHGMPAESGAGWFEGLSSKNHQALIMRFNLWKTLDKYLSELDEQSFRRALVFLRRTFADFSPQEKNDIAENLGELWNLNQAPVSLRQVPKAEEQQFLKDLDNFDFSDI